jgi:hypothetical protein
MYLPPEGGVSGKSQMYVHYNNASLIVKYLLIKI